MVFGSNKSRGQQPVSMRQVYISPPGGASGYLAPANRAEAGFNVCGMCRCCTCMHAGFLKTPTAAVKITEFVIGFVCQLLLLQYGMKYGKDLGTPYSAFLTCSSACLYTTSVLLICYAFSARTYNSVRPSLFEVVFNFLSCGLYLAASTLLATSVYFNLYYFYKTIPGFSAYPALTAVYVLGYIAGVVHGIDGCMALKFMRSQR